MTIQTHFERLRDIRLGKLPLTVKRSPEWPAVRSQFLKDNPTCAVCGTTTKLQVHHIYPVHLFPGLELAIPNLITLCENPKVSNHHYLFGHLLNWKSYNKWVRDDATVWIKKIQGRP